MAYAIRRALKGNTPAPAYVGGLPPGLRAVQLPSSAAGTDVPARRRAPGEALRALLRMCMGNPLIQSRRFVGLTTPDDSEGAPHGTRPQRNLHAEVACVVRGDIRCRHVPSPRLRGRHPAGLAPANV